jgi:hypothetical protein
LARGNAPESQTTTDHPHVPGRGDLSPMEPAATQTASRRSVCTDSSSTGGRSSRPCRITDPDETISRAYVRVRQVDRQTNGTCRRRVPVPARDLSSTFRRVEPAHRYPRTPPSTSVDRRSSAAPPSTPDRVSAVTSQPAGGAGTAPGKARAERQVAVGNASLRQHAPYVRALQPPAVAW